MLWCIYIILTCVSCIYYLGVAFCTVKGVHSPVYFCSPPVPRCRNQVLAVVGELHPGHNLCRTRNFLKSVWQWMMYQYRCMRVPLPECPNIVATHSPLLNSKMLMFLSEQLVATYWPDGSSCTCEDKRVRKESTHCPNIEMERGLCPEMLLWSGFHPRLEIPCRVSSVCHYWC